MAKPESHPTGADMKGRRSNCPNHPRLSPANEIVSGGLKGSALQVGFRSYPSNVVNYPKAWVVGVNSQLNSHAYFTVFVRKQTQHIREIIGRILT
jgi:hypothetical protein